MSDFKGIKVHSDAISFLEDEDGKKHSIGWVCNVRNGCEIFKAFPGWSDKNKETIKDFEGLKIGDMIIVTTFFGFTEAKVIEINPDKLTGSAESEYMVYPLEYSDRGWTNPCMISKKSMVPNIKLDDKNKETP